jgi:transporter family protein
MQSYVYWALRYGRLFLDHAVSGEVSSYMVLAVSSIIVPIFVIAVVGFRGELKPLIYDLQKSTLAWAIAGGLALTVAVTSLFQALSLGPANVVVPIYGMFIVGDRCLACCSSASQ